MAQSTGDEKHARSAASPPPEPPKGTWVEAIARVAERLVPDAITTSILLMIVLFILALALGNPVEKTVGAYYRGLWMLLQFTMQMTLMLLLSLVLAATPLFRKTVVLVSRMPRTTNEVVIYSCLLTAAVAYLNWGLALALGPMISIHFAKQAENKGIHIDFLFLMAVLAGAGSIWQFGLSASGPLLMASQNHFLMERTQGTWPLSTTIFTPASFAMIGAFTIATIVAGCALMPKKLRPLSDFPEAAKLAEDTGAAGPAAADKKSSEGMTIAQKLEHTPLVVAPLALALGAWLYHHFFVLKLSLELNSSITILLLACFALHGTIHRFTAALQQAIGSLWPVVVMYHLYAGVAGLIQFTPVGDFLSSIFYPFSSEYTYPFLTAVISTVVAVFLPSSGTQWAIQGLITINAAEASGVSMQRGLLALSVGDHMGNLISPFWAMVGAGIARVNFRLFFGYRLIFAAIWFVMGVTIFTFLPC